MSDLLYLLDSNVFVEYFRGRNVRLYDRLASVDKSNVALCAIVRAELEFGFLAGAYTEQRQRAQEEFIDLFVSLPVDDRVARKAAAIRYDLETRGLKIERHDMLIAATAIVNGLTLVSHDANHFSRVPDLRWEDWELPATA